MPGYVVYARKSTESEDRQVLSIQSQITELQRIAAREGVAVDEVLTESKSAKAPGRPVFGDLMRRIGRGEVRGVLCWKMDRLARNHFDTGQILQALADGKLDRVITSDRTYTRDGNDRFMGTFELGIATKFIDDLRSNVKRGLRARAERGWMSGRPPLGYANDPATKTIVKDAARFDLVRRMWDLLLSGTMRPEEIRRVANEEWGLRTPRLKRTGGNPICRSHLYRMFANPFYMGLLPRPDGSSLIGAHPPMVTREEFDRIQELFDRPGRARSQKYRHAYTGLLRCGTCGCSVTAEVHVKPSGRRYTYYRCTHNKRHVPCKEPAVPEPELRAQIHHSLKRLEIPESALAFLNRRIERSVEVERARRAQIRDTLSGAIEGLRREEENLLSLRLRDLVDDTKFVERRNVLQGRRQALEARLEGRSGDSEALGTLVASTLEFASRVAQLFAQGTTVQQRSALEAVGLNYVLRHKRVALEFKDPFRMVAEAGGCRNWCTIVDDVRTWLETRAEYFALPNWFVKQQARTVPRSGRFGKAPAS